MMRFLIPLILLLLGVGGGVGAGLVLAPAGEGSETGADDPHGEAAEGEHGEAAEEEAGHEEVSAEDAPDDEEPALEGAEGHEYIRLNNQFVVPLLTEGEVDSLVLLSIAIEVPSGQEESARMVEPKLRDRFLQVLFDHANAGGFDGLFTAASAMRELRSSLLAAAQEEVGKLVTDVLILDLARQDQ